MTTPNYDINYDDERLTQVESDKQVVLSEMENTYDGMINQSDSFYQSQIEASKEWADKQAQLQQENTNFAIEQIEQQKDKANKDYLKEQSGAYADWQKQSNKFGANAEQMASSGMANTGFSESSQVSMYNTYQNRVATARESYNQAILNYNNGIKEAQLQNNSKLAEIHFNALQQQLELALQGFQYKNQLIAEQTNKKLEVDNMYYQRYQDVLNQMNQENALAEEVRQYNEKMLEEQRQFDASLLEEQRQFDITSKNSTNSGDEDLNIDDTEQPTENRPSTIKGYGNVTQAKTSDGELMAVEIDGKEYDIYTTSDGTIWYWNGSKYVKYMSADASNTTRTTSLNNSGNAKYRLSTGIGETNPTVGYQDTIWESLAKSMTAGINS